jgi:hypothetical protein
VECSRIFLLFNDIKYHIHHLSRDISYVKFKPTGDCSVKFADDSR